MNLLPRPCEVCNKVDFVPFPNRRKIPLSRCLSCGLVRCTEIPTAEALAKIYGKHYYDSWGLEKNWDAVEAMKRRTFSWILDQTERLTPKKRSLLDIGCATGFLMAEAQQRGWNPYGLELSDYAFGKAQERFGDHVRQTELDPTPYPGVEFDAITMIDLLEHVTDPNALMTACRKVLSPKGLVVIGTPCLNSLTAKLFRGSWEHIKEEHLYYFSTETIRLFLKNNGFRLLALKPVLKSLTLRYVDTQFTIYPLPIVSPLVRLMNSISPNSWRDRPLRFTIGEMLALATPT